MKNVNCIEFQKISAKWENALADFFKSISNSANIGFFHPHPFTSDIAHIISYYKGKDIYMAITEGMVILGYGMLRGWEKGYETPSVGIIIAPELRGMKLGESFLRFLHIVAKRRGAKRIRIKVYPDNNIALNLYKKLGYQFFGETEANQLVGYAEI